MVVRFSGIVVTARALECKSRASQPSRVFCTRTHPAPTICEPLHGNSCPPSSAMGGREAHHRFGRSGKKERRTFVGEVVRPVNVLGSFYYFFVSYFFWFLKSKKVLKVVKRNFHFLQQTFFSLPHVT